jgi:protein SCO1/2
MKLRHSLAAVAILCAAPLARAAEPDDPHAACKAKAAAAAADAARPAATADVSVLDVALLDQHGASRRFRSEVVGDRAVVVDFVFTTCTTICPILSARMVRVQELLGGRAGEDVLLVSVSIDPVRDTPAKLAAYARKWKAGPGWTFLTGPKADVDAVLRGLGTYTPDFANHAPVFLVGDGRTGRWVRLNGFPDAARIVEQVDALLAARAATASTTGGRP